jgi:hypothetical protein
MEAAQRETAQREAAHRDAAQREAAQTEAALTVYHETQIERQCVVHAINMLLQARVVTFDGLVEFADAMRTHKNKPYPIGHLHSTTPGVGNFRPEVAVSYLKQKSNITLNQTIVSSAEQFQEVVEAGTRALIIHDGMHATAFASVDGVVFYLDSEAAGPQHVSLDLYSQLIEQGANRVFTRAHSPRPPQAPEHQCTLCDEFCINPPEWQLIDTDTEVCATLCDDCGQDISLKANLGRQRASKPNSMLSRIKFRKAGRTNKNQLQSNHRMKLSGSKHDEINMAERMSQHMLHELMCEGSAQPRLPGCCICMKKNKNMDELQLVGEGEGLRLFCIDCFVDWDNCDTEQTLQEYIQTKGKPECAACSCSSKQLKRCTDTDLEVLLCPTCTASWNQQIDIPSGYAVGTTMGQFVKAKGKPTVPTRDGRFIKPGDYIGHVSYKAPQGCEKGGAYWDIGRVTKVTERGSLVEFEDFEEVKGSEEQSTNFEHWRATGETFGAPVNELIVLTCQETNQTITVETTELKKVADAVEAEADRARRKRSALE